MIKRYLIPSILVALFVLLGAIVFVPNQIASAQAGVPWAGLFFSSPDFSGTSQTVTYPAGLSQNWGAGPPTNPSTGQVLPGIPADSFSATFTTSTTIQGGLYEFIVTVDGGARLRINDQVVFDNLTNTGLQTSSAIVNLVTGPYVIILDYVEVSGDALVQVNWVISDGTPTVSGGNQSSAIALGEVVQVRGLSLRSGPFLGATLLAVTRPGNPYGVLARNTQEGLFTWYLIQYDTDTTGWVSGRYFALTEGDFDAIPTVTADEFTTVYDPPGLVTGITRSNMNFRTLPTQRAPRVDGIPQLDWGATVEILARTRQGGQDFWYMVRYTPRGSTTSYVGWIFAPFVDIILGSDPIETIPRL